VIPEPDNKSVREKRPKSKREKERCMGGGIISTKKASGDVYFINKLGKEVIPALKDVEVSMTEEFPGMILRDALEEAKRFGIGAIQKKVAQKMRGFDCYAIVKNIRINYKIKFGFETEEELSRQISFKTGDQIIKKGDRATEFFWVTNGVVDIEGVEYGKGNVFGRAAFGDGVRKKDAFAKTDCTVISINKDHPDLVEKIPLILEKFAEEADMIKEIRPNARIEKVDLED
jgi:hypothetical protein